MTVPGLLNPPVDQDMCFQYHEELVGRHGLVIQLCEAQDEDVLRGALQCLENIAIR